MAKQQSLVNIYSRKLAVSVAFITIFSLVTPKIYYPEMAYVTGMSHLFFDMFLMIYVYGVWASLLSDVFASVFSDRTRIPEVYFSGVLHILAGGIFGLPAIVISFAFFLLDRYFIKFVKVNWLWALLSFGSIVIIFIMN
ncbi:MAG: hypothetical protein WCF60_10390 [Anaerobacillus sp.]